MLIFDKERKIHEQISPETWCQGPMFADSQGLPSEPTDETCQSACLFGWIKSVYFDKDKDYMEQERYADIDRRAMDLAEKMGYSSFIGFNDSPEIKFEDVLAFCKEIDI